MQTHLDSTCIKSQLDQNRIKSYLNSIRIESEACQSRQDSTRTASKSNRSCIKSQLDLNHMELGSESHQIGTETLLHCMEIASKLDQNPIDSSQNRAWIVWESYQNPALVITYGEYGKWINGPATFVKYCKISANA